MTTYRARQPRFEAIEWTGDVDTLASFVSEHAPPQAYSYRVLDEDGALAIGPYSTALVPAGGVLLIGPIFGADNTQASLRGVTTAELGSQFEPVA